MRIEDLEKRIADAVSECRANHDGIMSADLLEGLAHELLERLQFLERVVEQAVSLGKIKTGQNYIGDELESGLHANGNYDSLWTFESFPDLAAYLRAKPAPDAGQEGGK
jgi:hypothetical protein